MSVNFHFTRVCNYGCHFCFHTNKNNDALALEDMKLGLRRLREYGLAKINFSGGEPFLYARDVLGPLVEFCKNELGKDLSVSIVSNGSKITEAWLERYGKFVDILAISCDSTEAETNQRIGRTAKGQVDDQGDIVRRVARWCEQYDVTFKLNTVQVNKKKKRKKKERR